MPEHNRIYVLRSNREGSTAHEYMLRTSGDWRGYMQLMDSGAIEVSPFFRALINYYSSCINSFDTVKPIDSGLLMATSVWGKKYLDRFLNISLPTLLEKRNIEALKKAKAKIFIHTNVDGKDAIATHPVIEEFIRYGIGMQIMLLNDDLVSLVPSNPNNKYWHLGMTQSVHLQYAKALNSDYHLLMPDMVYSAGYFERLLNLKKPIITHGAISTDEVGMSEAFGKYRDGFSLSIPAGDLMSLSLLNSHHRAEAHYIKKNRKLPRTHYLIFEGKDAAHVMIPHQTIGFVSKKVIAKIPDRYFFTLDSELEKIFGDQEIYTPNIDDALVTAEISGEVLVYERKETESVEDYCKWFSCLITQKCLQNLFLQDISLPVNRDMLGDRWYMEEFEIADIREKMRIELCQGDQK